MTYQGLTDGKSHTYSFYSIGLDDDANLPSAPSSPNATFSNDLAEIAADIGATSQVGWAPLSADVTGSGAATTIDLTLATRSKNHKLAAGLSHG
jgi:hypothetical protein